MKDSKYSFERLTPIDNVDLGIYENAIDYIFEHSDIKNVAISGGYSSGKSSVLASYEKKHRDFNFLHISLAHFMPINQNDDKDEIKESTLEGKILNQLIHQIDPDKVPQTNFRIKRKSPKKEIIISTIFVVILLIALCHIFWVEMWRNFILPLPENCLKRILLFSIHPYGSLVSGCVIVILFSFLIYKLIKLQKDRNMFRKFNLKGNEIEIFEKSDDSFFDKYLNEVLYLFENAGVDVIVFEDIDRFDAYEIFERLHEINTLANIQIKKEGKSVLRFFYLLRDDIFVSKDRTKFFDYIIPIVPVIDSSNSYDQFINVFRKNNILKLFDEAFLQGLSLYIDDMRLLKNIYNEFLIYYDRLNTTDLDCNKMLAIITYKNIFPQDFSALQLNQGFVYTLFSRRGLFIAEETDSLTKKIAKKKNEIESLKKSQFKSLQDWDVLFAYKKLFNYSWSSLSQSKLHEFIKSNLSSQDKSEYLVQREEINALFKETISQRESDILELRHEIAILKNKSIQEIITRENIDYIFDLHIEDGIENGKNFDDVKDSAYFDLLKYLIRNGYIDETHKDYMTYFYATSLNIVDKIFLRSITDKKAKGYTYKLVNPQMIVSRLRSIDFEQEESLNFDLLMYLLQSSTNQEYLKRYALQLKKKKNIKFISEFFDFAPESYDFVKYLNEQWPELFSIAIREKSLTDMQIRNYAVSTIYYSDDATIFLVNRENCLRNYISNSKDCLKINSHISLLEESNIERVIHVFTLLDVLFVEFNYELIDDFLFRKIHESSLYEINFANISLIQREILKAGDQEIIHKNYTILSIQNPEAPITKYINQNIAKYMDVILKECNGSISDDETTAIQILNHPAITKEQKQSYLSFLQTKITSLEEVEEKSLWSIMLDNNILTCSEKNIMEYFNAAKQVDIHLVSYINGATVEFDFLKLDYDEDDKKDLFEKVVVCNDIKNKIYKQIVTAFGFYYPEFTLLNVEDDKMGILIASNIIRMTSKTIVFMRLNYQSQIFLFIKRYINDYIEIMTSELLVEEELLEILTWDVDDDLKIELLNFTNRKLSINNQYSLSVNLHILENNFSESDLDMLFGEYEKWDTLIQEKIIRIAIQRLNHIISTPSMVSDKLKNALLQSNLLDKDEKINLLVAMLPKLNQTQLEMHLSLMKLDKYRAIFNSRSRPKFKVSDESTKLLSAFKAEQIISDYKKIPGQEDHYKIVRRKQQKTLPRELL